MNQKPGPPKRRVHHGSVKPNGSWALKVGDRFMVRSTSQHGVSLDSAVAENGFGYIVHLRIGTIRKVFTIHELERLSN